MKEKYTSLREFKHFFKNSRYDRMIAKMDFTVRIQISEIEFSFRPFTVKKVLQ